jgi:hypothetical protein
MVTIKVTLLVSVYPIFAFDTIRCNRKIRSTPFVSIIMGTPLICPIESQIGLYLIMSIMKLEDILTMLKTSLPETIILREEMSKEDLVRMIISLINYSTVVNAMNFSAVSNKVDDIINDLHLPTPKFTPQKRDRTDDDLCTLINPFIDYTNPKPKIDVDFLDQLKMVDPFVHGVGISYTNQNLIHIYTSDENSKLYFTFSKELKEELIDIQFEEIIDDLIE